MASRTVYACETCQPLPKGAELSSRRAKVSNADPIPCMAQSPESLSRLAQRTQRSAALLSCCSVVVQLTE